MPPSDNEPENYSIDEMMERLKRAPSENPEDGEEVIRADGTHAIRLKKKKRRSNQPTQEQKKARRRVRIARVTAALVIIFLAIVVVIAAISYANSSFFREKLLRKIELTTGASVEMEQFRMNPQSANASTLTLRWPTGNILNNLALRGLKAEIFPSSFLGKLMSGDELIVEAGSLELQFPQPTQPMRAFTQSSEEKIILFNRYRIPKLNITLGNPKSPLLSVYKTEASLNTEIDGIKSQLSLYKGDVTIPQWPKLRLDRAMIEFVDGETKVVSIQIQHETDSYGQLELRGAVYPNQPDILSTLSVSLDSFQMSGITSPSFGRLISGRIDTMDIPKSNFLSFQTTENSSPTLKVAFQVNPSSRIEVRGFPFLGGLAQALDNTWFKEPLFDSNANGLIEREDGSLILRNFDFVNKNRLALRGEIRVSPDQKLSGNLEIGLAEPVMGTSRNVRLKALFGPARDGFHWLNLTIGGAVAAPTDDFKERLAAVGTAPPERSSSPEDSKATFEELTRPK